MRSPLEGGARGRAGSLRGGRHAVLRTVRVPVGVRGLGEVALREPTIGEGGQASQPGVMVASTGQLVMLRVQRQRGGHGLQRRLQNSVDFHEDAAC